MSTNQLVADHLTCRFQGLTAVKDVSMTIKVGDLCCLIGPNGAGKSTLLKMLSGSLVPTSGNIFFDGRNLTGLPTHHFARFGVSRKFQTPSLFDDLSVENHLIIAAHGDFSRIPNMLTKLSLGSVVTTPVNQLSFGQKQWLEIGLALVSKPKFLLLDEPSAGLSPCEIEMTRELIINTSDEVGIILTEHNLEFISKFECRTIVLNNGRILADGPFSTIRNDHLVRSIYLDYIKC